MKLFLLSFFLSFIGSSTNFPICIKVQNMKIELLICYCVASGILITANTSETVKLKMGVVLNLHSGLPFDYDTVSAPIALAIEQSLLELNVEFRPVMGLVTGTCHELATLQQTVKVLNDNGSVDLLLGPACTDDLILAAKLTTVYRTVLMTGGGSLVDSTEQWPYVARTAYNTLTQWSFFYRICRQFSWSNVGVIYEMDGAVVATSGPSKLYRACMHGP